MRGYLSVVSMAVVRLMVRPDSRLPLACDTRLVETEMVYCVMGCRVEAWIVTVLSLLEKAVVKPTPAPPAVVKEMALLTEDSSSGAVKESWIAGVVLTL